MENKTFFYKDKPYYILAKSKIKIYDDLGMNGVWQDVVVYHCMYDNPDGMIWVRFKDDFDMNFKPKEDD